MTDTIKRHAFSWMSIVLLSSLHAAEPKPVKPAPVERIPVPAEAKAAESENLIKEVLKEEYLKRGVPERIALANRLLQVASESKADPNLYYALLREARDVAVSAGEIDLAFNACDLLSQTFVLDDKELKSAVLLALARTPVTGEPALKFSQAGRELLDAHVAESQFDAAVKLLSPLEDLARRTNDPKAIKSLQLRSKEICAQQSKWARIKPHFDKLKENPADTDAALAVGKYHIAAGDWEKAVPVLSKCAAPALQSAAEKDLAAPADPEAKADAGDLWWSASEKETDSLKSALQQRALNWYQQALDGLNPVRKLKTEKRIQSALGAGNSIDSLKAAGLVFWSNPSADMSGMGRELLSDTAPKFVGTVTQVAENGIKVFKLNDSYPFYSATEPVKAISKSGSAFVWFRMDKSMDKYNGLLFKGVSADTKSGQGRTDFTLMSYGERSFLFFDWPDNKFPGVEGKTAFYSKRPAPLGKWTMFGATWDGATISLYINGERDISYKSTLTPTRRNDDSIVGLGCDPAGSNEGFVGLMGSAMLFNRALTEAEIRHLFLKSVNQSSSR